MATIKPRPFDAADRDIEKNFGAVNDHIEDKDFKLWLPARVFQTDLDVGASATEGGYVAAPYWNFVDGVTSVVVATHYRPDYWRVGYLGATLYFTGDTSSTNNINWVTQIAGFLENGVQLNLAGGDIAAASDDAVSGPGTAHELQIFNTPKAGWLAWTADYPFISVQVQRIGGAARDGYTGEARLLGVLLRYYPTRR